MWARPAGEWLEMGVSDNGAGIPRQFLPRVFEKFFRAPGQQGSTGSGLGLSIAKEIVEAHGGRIRVESAEGKGTTFAFTLGDLAPLRSFSRLGRTNFGNPLSLIFFFRLNSTLRSDAHAVDGLQRFQR